jgi:NADH:ubiquinone oxidoreductase subunit K
MHLSKLTLTLLILGLSGILVGLTFKLNHLMGAEQMFNAGMLAAVAGLLLAIRDVWRHRSA